MSVWANIVFDKAVPEIVRTALIEKSISKLGYQKLGLTIYSFHKNAISLKMDKSPYCDKLLEEVKSKINLLGIPFGVDIHTRFDH